MGSTSKKRVTRAKNRVSYSDIENIRLRKIPSDRKVGKAYAIPSRKKTLNKRSSKKENSVMTSLHEDSTVYKAHLGSILAIGESLSGKKLLDISKM